MSQVILAKQAKYDSIEMVGSKLYCFPDSENNFVLYKYQKN
jgi:hypothetical protein